MSDPKQIDYRKTDNPKEATWFILQYRPVSLFSLRMSQATSAGGKTLLLPTPYAFKLALVDAAVRVGGVALARQVFDWVKGAEVRFLPPENAVINQTFVKVLRPERGEEGEAKSPGPYIQSISYREFCFYRGQMQIALKVEGLTEETINILLQVAAHINYLGKRGSFFQFTGYKKEETLPAGFTCPAGEVPSDISAYGTGEFLDDIGTPDDPKLFDRINTFSDATLTMGKHRITRHYLIPYHQQQSARGYTYYKRKKDCFERRLRFE